MADQTTETVSQQKQETIAKLKNPLRVEQGERLVEYNRRKKQEVKNLSEQITKQYDMIECKPGEPSNIYLYISGVSVVGLAIAGYLLYNALKKPRYISIYMDVENCTKDLKESIYHDSVVSALAVGSTVL